MFPECRRRINTESRHDISPPAPFSGSHGRGSTDFQQRHRHWAWTDVSPKLSTRTHPTFVQSLTLRRCGQILAKFGSHLKPMSTFCNGGGHKASSRNKKGASSHLFLKHEAGQVPRGKVPEAESSRLISRGKIPQGKFPKANVPKASQIGYPQVPLLGGGRKSRSGR